MRPFSKVETGRGCLKNSWIPKYNQGDLIWVKVLSNRSKFDSRFHGPFTIIKRINDVKYIIEHTEMHYQQEEHVNNFIPFYDRN
jgi:hypothetical protein